MKVIKKILVIIVSLIGILNSYATHIVGGEITYTHLVGNTYEVTLIVYRDDYNGSTAAQFDSPAMVYLYNNAGQEIDNYDFTLSNPNTATNYIPNPYPNPCLELPVDANGDPTITIQKGIYKRNITVPNGNVGYHLIYARCCRNGALINNLINPGDQGAKYTVYIPPTNIYNNNSPTFDEAPPIFVCLGSPLSFDQSATDIDGDSLVYSLCSPYQGLDASAPILQPGNTPPFGFGPPFTNVIYSNPFSANDPLGGTPLNIDQNTGLLTGTPNAVGSYVVGICVSEYRNGVLLSTILRDFQYTVTNCNIPTANIPTIGSIDVTDLPNPPPNLPENILGIYFKNCDNLTVDFINTSTIPGGGAATATNADYWWDFGDGVTSTAFEPTHIYPDTGTYVAKLAITVSIGTQSCTDTGYYVVYIYPTFILDFQVDNSCALDSSHFFDISSTAFYDQTNEWDWDFGDGSTHSLIKNPKHIYSAPGDYEIILFARTEKGCTQLDTGNITIYPLPVSAFNQPNPICLGDTFNFISTSTIISGTIDSTYWDMSGGVFSFSDSFNIFNNSGVFPITLVNASNFGCLNSITKNLTVNSLPNITTSGNDTICTFTNIQVSASGGNSYLWSPANELDNASIFNPTITPVTPKYYKVIVTDNNNCSNTDSLYIDLMPPPIADAGEDTSVCLNIADVLVFNQSVQLQATGGISYLWSPITGLNNPNISNPIATPTINKSYIVKVSDIFNCFNFDTVNVIVLNPALDLIKVTTDSLCLGDTVYVDVEDQGAITNYSWNPTNFVTDANLNEPGFFPSVNTLYILTISNYCYQDADSVLIEVLSTPMIDAGPLDSICLNDPPYQLNANPTNYEIYNWSSLDNSISNENIANPSISPTTNSMYYLSITDSIGTLACTNEDSVEILVFNNPTLNIQTPTDYLDFICQDDSVLLKAISNDAIIYQWDVNATLSSLNTANTFAFPLDTQKYIVSVENTHGCINKDSIVINVQKPITGKMLGDSIMCVGFYINLEASGGIYYHWYPNDANFNNANYSKTQAQPNSNLQIFVDISNDCFHDTLFQDITVYQLPEVEAGEDFTMIRDDGTAFLDGTGDGKPLWYTSELNFNGILNSPAQYGPEIQPNETTRYVLEIENPANGCKNYDTVLVTVDVLTLLAFPTAFSPNGDGTNDIAHIIKHLNIKSLEEFSIYNRYGEKIFTTDNINDFWDGTYKDSKVEMGVYIYLINAITKDNEVVSKKGNISLIR